MKKNKKLKAKTHRGAAKRFKITSTGKVMRWRSGKRHLLGTKKPRRMRRLLNKVQVSPGGREERASGVAVRLVKAGLKVFCAVQCVTGACQPVGSARRISGLGRTRNYHMRQTRRLLAQSFIGFLRKRSAAFVSWHEIEFNSIFATGE